MLLSRTKIISLPWIFLSRQIVIDDAAVCEKETGEFLFRLLETHRFILKLPYQFQKSAVVFREPFFKTFMAFLNISSQFH